MVRGLQARRVVRLGGKPPGARAARFMFPDIIVNSVSYEKAARFLGQARAGVGVARWWGERQRCLRRCATVSPGRGRGAFTKCGQFPLEPKHRAQVQPGPIAASLRKLDWITGVPLPCTLVKVRRRSTDSRSVESLPRSFCRAGMLCIPRSP